MKGVVGLGLGMLLVWVAAGGCISRGPEESAAELALQAAESRISFIGIKNNAIAVPGSFAGLSGGLDAAKRRAWVEVPLGRLLTGDPERDKNISVHFFNAPDFPTARFSVESVDGAEELPLVGERVELVAKGVLEIHGARVALDVPVRLTREGQQRIRVQSTGPLVLTAEQLGLSEQHEILKAVCGHKALSAAVPLELDLVFAAGG